MALAISLGEPPGPSGNNTVFEEASTNRVPRDFYTVHRYEEDMGIYLGGIASPAGFQGNKAAVFQLAAPRTLLIIDWTLEQAVDQNDYADFPDWNPYNSNYILADRIVEPASLDVMGDGTSPIYRISGTYVYLVLNGDTVEWRHGRPPWVNKTVPVKVNLSTKATKLIW